MAERLIRVNPALGARLLCDAGAVYDAITSAPLDSVIDLGDAWAGLHFLLSGGELPMPHHVARGRGLAWDDESLENVLLGGAPTRYEDAYTVARYLAPAEVAVLAHKLAALPADQLVARLDDGIHEVLPVRWRRKPDLAEQLAARFEQVATFYRITADRRQAILSYMA